VTIDTLKVARRLREAGFTEPQAEAVVAAVREGAEGGDLARKQDLGELRFELKTEISELRAELKAEIAELRFELKTEISELRAETREMEQRLIARIEAAKSDMIARVFSMIIGAVLVNIVAMLGAMFAFAKLLGH
jgi:molecular chaperone GrpE (heat shock protein)